MNEQELKEKIKSLYEELIEKKRFLSAWIGVQNQRTTFWFTVCSEGVRITGRCKKKLASIDSAKYNTLELQITINKDVENVRGYFYKYDKSCKPTSKSIAEIQQMMSDATSQIYRDFVCKVDDDKV